jgi:hypothetical protein
MALDLNLAYIDSMPAIRNDQLPPPEPCPHDAKSMRDLKDKTQWLEEQAALTASMMSMYQDGNK